MSMTDIASAALRPSILRACARAEGGRAGVGAGGRSEPGAVACGGPRRCVPSRGAARRRSGSALPPAPTSSE